MPVWYNPLGTRAVEWGQTQLGIGGIHLFGFNGIVHLSWLPGAPSAAYFEFTHNAGITWATLLTFPIAGSTEESVMVANGITRVRRAAAGAGQWPIRWGGWRFT